MNIQQDYPDQIDMSTERTKSPPHHVSNHQVWKHWMLHCFFPSCSDNKQTKSTFSVKFRGAGILLYSSTRDLLKLEVLPVSSEQKIQWNITWALKEHGKHCSGAAADKKHTINSTSSQQKATELSALSPSLLSVRSYWWKFLWHRASYDQKPFSNAQESY